MVSGKDFPPRISGHGLSSDRDAYLAHESRSLSHSEHETYCEPQLELVGNRILASRPSLRSVDALHARFCLIWHWSVQGPLY